MKYQVIVVQNEENHKNYYHSYVEENGNIECDDLPPFADTLKARSCYWDDGKRWNYDDEQYQKLLKAEEDAKKQAEIEQNEALATPTNAELRDMLFEITEVISEMQDAITDLGESVDIVSSCMELSEKLNTVIK